MDLRNYIASIPDFPKQGILFRDMTPLLQDKDALQYALDQICEFAKKVKAQNSGAYGNAYENKRIAFLRSNFCFTVSSTLKVFRFAIIKDLPS